MEINLPTIDLRKYQRPFWEAMEAGARRAATVWPRRAGKDTVSLQWTAWDLHRHIGNYWHLFPEKETVKKAIWKGLNKDGERIIDVAFPLELRSKTLDNEMFIEFKCGSTWQLGGSDRYDALMGANPRGVVFSEYAISNPRAYQFVRPILAENGGWALFPYTPRGRNHGFELFEMLSKDPNSFAELLTCHDTGHMDADALELERLEMSEELYLQEYFGSWDFGLEGAYYARYMNRARVDGRICAVAYDQARPVFVGGDIGLKDSTALWFWQVNPDGSPQWIDYLEKSGEQVKYYVDEINARGYTLGAPLFLPHDSKQHRLGMPRSVAQQFNDLGMDTRVLPQEAVQPGIETCRVNINRSLFDEDKTAQGRSALNAYRREYDDKRQVFKPTPLHDWSSDGADGFRYCNQAIDMGLCDTTWGGTIDYSTLDRAVI